MRGGRIAQAGGPHTLYSEPADLEIALFLGEAVVLAAEVSGDFAETALGRLPMAGDRGRTGAGLATLRPEQIRCHPGEHGDDPRGTIVAGEFYGRDATMRVRIEGGDGTEVLVRSAGHRRLAVGERVSLAVEGEARVFFNQPS